MGVPAGLKLNAQLTEYMGQFFLYHVYLWSGDYIYYFFNFDNVFLYAFCIKLELQYFYLSVFFFSRVYVFIALNI